MGTTELLNAPFAVSLQLMKSYFGVYDFLRWFSLQLRKLVAGRYQSGHLKVQ